MRKLVLGLAVSLVLTGCSGGMFSFDPTGSYEGTWTATVGDSGTTALNATIQEGHPTMQAITGLVAVLSTPTSEITLLCNDVIFGKLECYVLDTLNRHVTFEGPVNKSRWSGTWVFSRDLAGTDVVLSGTFNLNKR